MNKLSKIIKNLKYNSNYKLSNLKKLNKQLNMEREF